MKIDEVKRNAFYKFPKWLFDEEYQGLSLRAKIAYILIFDRVSLSVKNNWHDKDGNVFVYYPNEELMGMLNCSEKSLIIAKKELVEYGLIKEIRQGISLPNRLYIYGKGELQHGTVKTTALELEKLQHGTVKITALELEKLQTTKTDNTKTDITKTDITKTETVVGGNFRYNSKTPSIGQALKDNNINLTTASHQKLMEYITDFHLSTEMIAFAAEQTGEISNPSFKYLRRILDSWIEKGFTSLEQVKANEKQRERAKSQKQKQDTNIPEWSREHDKANKELEKELTEEERQKIFDDFLMG